MRTAGRQRSWSRLLIVKAALLSGLGVFTCAMREKYKAEIVPKFRTPIPSRPVVSSRDGRLVLSGGLDQTVELWDAATRALVRAFQGHSQSVIAFS